METPDTAGYMILGYVVFVSLPLLFILSLAYRYRSLRRDEEAVKHLEKDDR